MARWIAVLVALSVLLSVAHADPRILLRAADDKEDDNGNEPYQIGLWGDVPYSDLQAQTGVRNLIKHMNSFPLKFSVHNGDWKAGSGNATSVTVTTCADGLYTQALGYLNSLRAPAMYTPGDNEWTDCDRASNSPPNSPPFNSRERMSYIRRTFFSTDRSFGARKKIKQIVQSAPLCQGFTSMEGCVENRRWTLGRVTYITLNIPGSCNNLCDTAPDPVEYAARNAANIKWLLDSFADAKTRNSVAVMIISQANPGWDLADPTRAPVRNAQTFNFAGTGEDGYKDYLLALREQVIAFNKPVAYVHGDSHYFVVDKPLLDRGGKRINFFTRCQTPGDNQANGNNDVNWVRVYVNPKSYDVFSFQCMVVPDNQPATFTA